MWFRGTSNTNIAIGTIPLSFKYFFLACPSHENMTPLNKSLTKFYFRCSHGVKKKAKEIRFHSISITDTRV